MENNAEQLKNTLGATVEMVAFTAKEFERNGFGRTEAVTAALEVIEMILRQGRESNGREERN